jgi:hypothetical protein
VLSTAQWISHVLARVIWKQVERVELGQWIILWKDIQKSWHVRNHLGEYITVFALEENMGMAAV